MILRTSQKDPEGPGPPSPSPSPSPLPGPSPLPTRWWAETRTQRSPLAHVRERQRCPAFVVVYASSALPPLTTTEAHPSFAMLWRPAAAAASDRAAPGSAEGDAAQWSDSSASRASAGNIMAVLGRGAKLRATPAVGTGLRSRVGVITSRGRVSMAQPGCAHAQGVSGAEGKVERKSSGDGRPGAGPNLPAEGLARPGTLPAADAGGGQPYGALSSLDITSLVFTARIWRIAEGD